MRAITTQKAIFISLIIVHVMETVIVWSLSLSVVLLLTCQHIEGEYQYYHAVLIKELN